MNFLPLGLFAAGLLFCLVFTAFGCTIVVSLASVAIACNQTLSSIMVQELRQSLYDDKEEMALLGRHDHRPRGPRALECCCCRTPGGPRCLILGHCRCRLPLLAATLELAAHIFSQT